MIHLSRRSFIGLLASTALTPFVPPEPEPTRLFGAINFSVHGPRTGDTLLLNGKLLTLGPIYSWEGPRPRNQSVWEVGWSRMTQFGLTP